MGFLVRQTKVLKLVHPGRHVEVFREPITAGEIMRKYPRHCIARPDVFEFPWIVVRPESLLVPGKVFYLVPYHTMNNLLKAKIQQIQSSKHHHHYLISMQGCCMNPLAGVTQKHQHYGRCRMRWTDHTNLNDHESCQNPRGKASCAGSLYKQEVCKSWEKMRRKLNRGSCFERFCSEPDSPLYNIRLRSSEMRIAWGQYSSTEKGEGIRLKPCLRKADSVRPKLDLKVRFDQQGALTLHF